MPPGNRTVRSATLSVRPASPLRESLSVGSASASTVLKTGRELYPYEAKGFRFRFGAAPARAAWADPLS